MGASRSYYSQNRPPEVETMKRSGPALVLIALVAGSCGGGDDAVAPTSAPVPTVRATTTLGGVPTTVAGVVTTSTSSLPPATTASAPVTSQAPLPSAPSIAVGPGGIEYRGGGTELERTGPRLLAVAPDGSFHIYDPVGHRIWSFAGGAPSIIDLLSVDVLNVEAVAAAADHLIVVEIFFGPVRHRVHRIGYDGSVIETIELPEGFRLEDGLSGVLTGAEGEIVLELAGGAAYGTWAGEETGWVRSSTLALGQTTVAAAEGGIEVNGTFVPADLTTGLGGLRYLATANDGTVVLVREDVVATDPVFEVVSTVEWYTAAGAFIGSARAPSIADQYTDEMPGLAVGPDGRVYALITRETSVDVVELERTSERITDA